MSGKKLGVDMKQQWTHSFEMEDSWIVCHYTTNDGSYRFLFRSKTRDFFTSCHAPSANAGTRQIPLPWVLV